MTAIPDMHTPACAERTEALLVSSASYALFLHGSEFVSDHAKLKSALALPCSCATLATLRRVEEAAKNYAHRAGCACPLDVALAAAIRQPEGTG